MAPRYTIRQVVGTYRRKAFGTTNEDGSARRPAYPAAAIVAFYGVLELAEEQPVRGHFESERLLAVLLEGPKAKGRPFSRQIRFLIDQGDLVRTADGGLDVEGWQELQEGDVGIADRVARFRARKKAPVTHAATPTVTAPVTPDVTEEPRATATEEGKGYSAEGDGDGNGNDFPSPTAVGRRANGTNPRALGTNPRAEGRSPRQERAAEKRAGMPVALAEIMRRAQAGDPA